MASRDFDPVRMLSALADRDVRFVLIGGMAAVLHGDVGVTDLLAVLAAWGGRCVDEDVDRSGDVAIGDVLLVLSEWGACE